MKRKTLIFPLIAVMLVAVFGLVSAGEIAKPGTIETEFNGVDLSSGTTMAGLVGDTVPVRVVFDSMANLSDVRVKVRMEGHREEISAITSRFDVLDGVTYSKLLSLELPSDEKDLTKEYTLYVEISSASDRSEVSYTIKMQRDSYALEILSVDYQSQVEAGSVVPVYVVLKNRGLNRVDDNYVIATIPALGISSRTYVGDLVAQESADLDNEEDSVYSRVYLRIPESAKSGVYDMDILAYNDDSKTKVTKKIAIESIQPEEKTNIDNKDAGQKQPVTGDVVGNGTEEDSTSIVALTVVLVIIFVVLLAVLVVLLTKKEKPAEEVETSYY